MNFLNNIREAITNLRAAKLRSFLAVLGILVGTASVVAMVSSGQLAADAALEQFRKLGTNLLAMYLQAEDQAADDKMKYIFNTDNALAIKDASENIYQVAPYVSSYSTTIYDGEKISAPTIGATEELASVIKIIVAKPGRFISYLDGYEQYCVVGSELAEQMEHINPAKPIIGSQISIGKNIFTVVGIAKPWPENSFFYENVNRAVIIPIKAASLLSKYASIRHAVLRVNPDAEIPGIEDDIRRYMNNLMPGVSINFRSAQQIIESMEQQKKIFTILLGVIGSISLIVGGIGVMNIMLVSVVERRREIGIRMAVGAKRQDIRNLFLFESITLSLFGGFVGMVLGISASYIIAMIQKWHFTLYVLPPVIGFAVSVTVGIFFGFYPAVKASKLDPIETLRAE